MITLLVGAYAYGWAVTVFGFAVNEREFSWSMAAISLLWPIIVPGLVVTKLCE